MDKRRVVVTGVGAVTPFGVGREALWDGLKAGKSAVGRLTRFDPTGYPTTIAAQVKDFEPEQHLDPREYRRWDRFTQFAVASALLAVRDAGIDLSGDLRHKTGVMIGSGIGGIETLENQARVLFERGPRKVSPFFVPMMIGNMASSQTSISLGLTGPNTTVATACASSAHAVGDAFRTVARGDALAMLAGGSESPITPLAFAGFCSLRAMSTRNDAPERASRPFDRDRDGFVMGEGAAVLVLEERECAVARGARIYAELVGYGLSADAYHMVMPAPDGEGAARAMSMALYDAGLAPEDVDYVNAHGTSTELNDRCETQAIKRVFGEHAYRLHVSSTKSMIGHLLGAAGAVEAAACMLAVYEDVVHPTVNYEKPDPECDLDYVPGQARRVSVRAAISNSFGFGGQNAVLAFRKHSS